jgi:hypothetical protein
MGKNYKGKPETLNFCLIFIQVLYNYKGNAVVVTDKNIFTISNVRK